MNDDDECGAISTIGCICQLEYGHDGDHYCESCHWYWEDYESAPLWDVTPAPKGLHLTMEED